MDKQSAVLKKRQRDRDRINKAVLDIKRAGEQQKASEKGDKRDRQ